MKLKNILSIFCFLFIAVACSTEDDIMNDVDKEVQSASEVYGSLNVSLGTDEIQTKTVENAGFEQPSENESTVKNCYLAVFDNNTKQLLASRLYTDLEASEDASVYVLNENLVFKVSSSEEKYPDLLLVAIANMNKNDEVYGRQSSITRVQACSDYDDLMSVVLKEDPTVLVKVGERTIPGKDYGDYVNVSKDMISQGGGKKSIQIDVKQRAAAIELAKLDIESELGETTEVQVESLQLLNMVYSSTVGSYDISNVNDSYIATSEQYGDLSKYRLYTYENPVLNNEKTKLRIGYSYKLNGKKETGFSEITIKTPTEGGSFTEEVKANHIYKLSVAIKNALVDVSVKFVTQDWKYNSNKNDFEFTYEDKK